MVGRFGAYLSTRSHLSFLPRRRIGVVAQTNGGSAGTITDLIAAFAYDLEAAKPRAREVAEERLQAIIVSRTNAMRGIAIADSLRAARQTPLRRPAADFAGTYFNEKFGALVIEARGERLRFRWGVLDGDVEAFDVARDQFSVPIGGSAQVVSFVFPSTGRATAFQLLRETFNRQ
jgi:hypothetical protein